MCFQYLGFHDHTFNLNREKLAIYVISPGFHKQAFHGQAAEFSCPGFHDKQQNSLPMHCNDKRDSTTTVQSMNLNHTPAVQIQTPQRTAQNFGNIGPSTLAVIVQQQVQPTTIPTQTGSFSAQTLPPQTTARMTTFTMPVNHIFPNLSAWTFPNPTVTPAPIPTTIPPPTQPTAPTFMPFAHTPTYAAPTVPVTVGGTVFLCTTSNHYNANCVQYSSTTDDFSQSYSRYVCASRNVNDHATKYNRIHDTRSCFVVSFNEEKPFTGVEISTIQWRPDSMA